MTTPDRRLTEEEVSAVFRRAAELDHETTTEPTALDRSAIERVAVEAGLSLDAVRRALAELDAGRLTSARQPRAWEWPEGTVTVERRLPVDAAVARKRLTSFLRHQTLRVVRDRGNVTVWELAEGVAANVARGVNPRGRIRLKNVNRVVLSIEPHGEKDEEGGEGEEGCTVRFELDFRRTRREKLTGAAIGSSIGTATAGGGAVAAITATELAAVFVPVGAAMALGIWFGSRSDYTARIGRGVAAVELALDQLEAEPRGT